MKAIILGVLIIVVSICTAWAADVKIDWDGVENATGYKMAMSVDNGATWAAAVDMKLVKPFIITNVPEDRLVLFKIAAYNAISTTWKEYAFAGYDHRKKPLPETSGPGIK